jgi:hypothetical protein
LDLSTPSQIPAKFSVPDALKAGWMALSKGTISLLGMAIVMTVAPLIIGFIVGAPFYKHQSIWILGGIAFGCLSAHLLLRPIWVKMCLSRCNVQTQPLNLQLYITFVGAFILWFLASAVGLILLVVPGLYVLTVLMFFPFIIVDQRTGPIEALKISYKMSKGIFWQLFCLVILYLIVGWLLSRFSLVGIVVQDMAFGTASAMVYARRSQFLKSAAN